MKFYNDILGLIGNTPLVRVNHITKQHKIKATIFAKMESLNPGYSVKDRIGISMIDWAEKEGVLKKGGTIIEATSGNTGIGLALVGGGSRVQMHFCSDGQGLGRKGALSQIARGRHRRLSGGGKPGTPDHYVATAKRISEETPNSFYPDQYNHPANPLAHYLTTGPEIWDGHRGQDHAFRRRHRHRRHDQRHGPLSKGDEPGTSRSSAPTRTARSLRPTKNRATCPRRRPIWSRASARSLPVGNADMKMIDEIINITDRESFEYARQLSRREGIFCGGSTGTNFAAALKVAKDLDEYGRGRFYRLRHGRALPEQVPLGRVDEGKTAARTAADHRRADRRDQEFRARPRS